MITQTHCSLGPSLPHTHTFFQKIPVCHVTSDVDPKTFETVYVTGDENEAYAGDLEGPCTEWLGELCDDDLKCTIDYDYDAVKCLPEPRETIPTCTETMEDI